MSEWIGGGALRCHRECRKISPDQSYPDSTSHNHTLKGRDYPCGGGGVGGGVVVETQPRFMASRNLLLLSTSGGS